MAALTNHLFDITIRLPVATVPVNCRDQLAGELGKSTFNSAVNRACPRFTEAASEPSRTGSSDEAIISTTASALSRSGNADAMNQFRAIRH